MWSVLAHSCEETVVEIWLETVEGAVAFLKHSLTSSVLSAVYNYVSAGESKRKSVLVWDSKISTEGHELKA